MVKFEMKFKASTDAFVINANQSLCTTNASLANSAKEV